LFFFPPATVEISEMCKEGVVSSLSHQPEDAAQGCPAISAGTRGCPRAGDKKPARASFHGRALRQQSRGCFECCCSAEKSSFPGGLHTKKKWHLLAWPAPRRAAAACPGEAARFPLAKLAAKLGSCERALSAAWDGGGSGSRREL